MAMGIIDSLKSGHPLNSPFLYGRNISFGYYGLIHVFTPIFRENYALIINFMNYINAITAILMVIPLFFLVKRFWGSTVAIFANILLLSVPVWWNLSRYGHPMMQALFFMYVGLALIGYRSSLVSQHARIIKSMLLDFLIIMVLTAGLTFRFDIILMFPLVSACLVLANYSIKSNIFYSIIYGFIPIILFIVLQSQLPILDKNYGSTSIVQDLLFWHGPSRFISNIIIGSRLFFKAFNIAYLVLFSVSCIYIIHKRNYRTLFFIGPCFILNYIFWLPNAYPERHFIYAAPILAVSIALWLAAIYKSSRILRSPYKLRYQVVILGLFTFIVFVICVHSLYFASPPYPERKAHDASLLANELQKLDPKEKTIVVVADAVPIIVQMQLIEKNIVADYKVTNTFKTRLLIIENGRNRFIFFTQAWLSHEVAKFLEETVEYEGAYLIVDKYSRNPKITFDPSRLHKKFDFWLWTRDTAMTHDLL